MTKNKKPHGSGKKDVSLYSGQQNFPRFPSLLSRHPFFNFDDLFAPFFGGRGLMRDIESENQISVSEDKNHIYIDLAIPGVEPKNVNLRVENGYLSVEAAEVSEESNAERHFFQKASRSCSYCFKLPENIKQDTPKAIYKHGLLKLTFAKLQETQAKKINIEVEE